MARATDLGSDRSPGARYDVALDPADLFIVWDSLSECPALVDAELLAYESFGEAHHVAEKLNGGRWNNRQAGFHGGNPIDSWA